MRIKRKTMIKDLLVEFNISHSGNIVVYGVSSIPIGTDVEQIRLIDMKVVSHICYSDELAYIFDQTTYSADCAIAQEPEILTRFFKIWTTKEAYCKCLGTGITDLKSINTQALIMEIHRFDFRGYCVSFCTMNRC